MNIEQIIIENAKRNAAKKHDYDPVSGLNCYGERFVLTVPEKNPRTFYLPIEMKNLKAVKLLQKHGSITATLRAQFNNQKPNQAQIDYFWMKICEERYTYDFEFFAISCVTIRDKETADTIKLQLNPAQRMLLEVFEDQRKAGIQITVQVLKAKQMGFSTLTQMYMKWIQIIHKLNWNSVVCAHTRDAAINVRSMYQRSIDSMMAINGQKISMKGFGTTQNMKEVPERGCLITVGFATEPDSVRSQDVKMVHFSEEAFYPSTDNNNPELLEAGIISSSTTGPFTMIVRESTANGVGDFFYEQWQKAKKQETAFEPVFAPWFMIRLYETQFDGSYYLHNGRKKKGTVADFVGTLDEYEWNLWNNHTKDKICTLENLNWRRMKAATMPSESKMKQEYPSDDIEAFQDSGSPVFKAEDVEAMRPDCRLPDVVGTLASLCPPELALTEPHRRSEILKELRFVKDEAATEAVLHGDAKQRLNRGINKLHVWEMPDKEIKISNRYLVVFDPQKGVSESADYGVIKVLDRYWMMYGEKPEIVAMFYGHIDKDVTIWIAAQIAKWYNNALLVVESNTYDSDNKEDQTEYIFETIKEYYDNLYSRTPAEKVREGAPIRYGFNTNRSTKPMIIANFKAILREQGYIERDEETLNEARVYEEKKDGTTGAKHGKHDDRLMATMILITICFQMPIPAEIKAAQTGHVKRTAW